jgi:hypothetical protein
MLRWSAYGVVLIAAWLCTGCASTERHEVRVIHETQEEPVVEEKPGEMVVE